MNEEILLENKIKTHCPICNWRVFDIEKGTKGCLVIKCPNCRHISRISVAFRLKRPKSISRVTSYSHG